MSSYSGENAPTIDDAIAWTERAEKLGYYKGGNTTRLLKAATEAVKQLLDEGEPNTLDYVLDRLEKQLHARLLNKASGLSSESAKTYIQRTGRLLRDYRSWLEDPTAFAPASRRNETKASAKAAKPRRSAASEDSQPHEKGPAVPPTSPGQRQHSISLSGGQAVLSLPEKITVMELRTLCTLLSTHCPEAPLEWSLTRRGEG